MTENEISDRYRKRFSNFKQVNQYINETLVDVKEDTITLNILVIPSNIEHRIIDTSNYDEIEKLQSIHIPTYFQNNGFPNFGLHPFSNGLTSKHPFGDQSEELQIHRNGCIQYVGYYAHKNKNSDLTLPFEKVATKLMQSLKFSYDILSDHNYFEDVKIITRVRSSSSSILPDQSGFSDTPSILHLNVLIERECSSYHVEMKYEQITSSIMNEIFNHYGSFRCQLFSEDGNYTRGR